MSTASNGNGKPKKKSKRGSYEMWGKSYRHAPVAILDCRGHVDTYQHLPITDIGYALGLSEKAVILLFHRIQHLRVCLETNEPEILVRNNPPKKVGTTGDDDR